MHLYAGEEELDQHRYYDREAVLELSRELFQPESARTFFGASTNSSRSSKSDLEVQYLANSFNLNVFRGKV
jgi:hypothetical protein